ncbi:MAG: family N-acetyltransferase [Bacteroidetes bacterium]|jgi:RimJ/RimL family protein N-acetyltransferase|nr:family N-acetyltransferase [Bacteroidota bacterium]
MPEFILQQPLENDIVKLVPLKESDFELLYKVASDPLVWEQHPNKDRYKREVFLNFFEGAIKSKGAYLILDKQTNEVIGSSRYYDYKADEKVVAIGYTFFARSHWGGKYNPSAKKLMMDLAFKYVDSVLFYIGAMNVRSQKAIERLGAIKIGEEEIAYYGEASRLNFIYRIGLHR